MNLADLYRLLEAQPSDAVLVPSRETVSKGEQALADMPLERVVRDVAVVVAEAAARELEAQGLRGADFVDDETADRILQRVTGALSSQSDLFRRVFDAHLALRG